MNRALHSRREFLGAGLGAAVATGIGGIAVKASTVGVTAPVGEGPFYPIHEQAERDFDLTRFKGTSERAEGELVIVEGQVLDDAGNPVAGAFVDVWQANTWGRYHHEKDPNPAPRDPNFQGWAQIVADKQGRYRLLTIKPGAYPVDKRWTRPPHIHFKVSKRGFHEITTQMFFEDEPLNDLDRLFLAVPEKDRPSVVAKASRGRTGDGEEALHCQFDIVLRKV